MAKPQLPSSPTQTWGGGFLLDQASPVRWVEARNGLVVAGGDRLYLLRPGQEHIKHREIPLDIGPVHLAAAEPRGQRRYAFASQEMIALFLRRNGEDQIVRIRPTVPGPVARSLAWAGAGSACALWVLWDDGEVARIKPEAEAIDPLNLPPMAALASDDAGNLALVSFDPTPLVYVTADGETLQFRDLPLEPPDVIHRLHLAVAGTAVALSVNDGPPLVSRSVDDPFTACEPLAGAGPLAFEGTDPGAALFGAIRDGSEGALIRVDRSGAAMRTAEFGADGGAGAIEIAAISWDAPRHQLWAASPQAGLLTSVAPAAKKGKKALS
jgi:hypothetical protein